jgi:ATP-dependent Lon protease
MFFREPREPDTPTRYPLLPLREVVVFPGTPMSLIVGRARSVAAVRAASESQDRIVLVAQKDGECVEPEADDLHRVGTLASIVQVLHLPDGNTKLVVEGLRRARIREHHFTGNHYEVDVELDYPPESYSTDILTLMRSVKASFERFVKLNRAVPPEMLLSINAIESPERLADSLVAPLKFKLSERQELLEQDDLQERLERIYKALLAEIEFLQVEKKLKTRIQRERDSSQREQWLQDQMQNIQKELGDKGDKSDLEELAERLAAKELPTEIRDRAEKEFRRLSQMNMMNAEANVVRNYLDWIINLPWTERSPESPSLKEAVDILNEDHFGLHKIKERIIEYLAVATLVDQMRGPILCLVGPPGVGKTSLARSIARATGRPFVRISLGGVRDEAEIRGHRRTYIGAMPGKVIQALKRAATVDAVVLLDEVDKMSNDFRGDPSSALLEVLDHEQNAAFNDHFLELDYDLSKVTFVCTANTLQGIPGPMRDRLEIIMLSGYTEQEKLAIARKYLVSKQMELNGIGENNLKISNAALLKLIQLYTKESGVRELERQLATICRKVARRVVRFGKNTSVKVVSSNLKKLLGPEKFDVGTREAEDEIGMVKGLAVSPWGGELLNIEVATVPGKGELILTGRLGDWLKESATAGFTYVRARSAALHLDPDFYETQDFHVHYPGNALQTDGPSAGIAMATALVSALTGIPVRSDTAMTGEISLRGRVLPIGGLKEKVLAAHRGGITRVIIPHKNLKDLEEIPAKVLETVEIIAVSHMDRVLREALSHPESNEIFATYGHDPEFEIESSHVEAD